ncbi:MAG: extensin family protein [Pseudomonadota bacterium]
MLPPHIRQSKKPSPKRPSGPSPGIRVVTSLAGLGLLLWFAATVASDPRWWPWAPLDPLASPGPMTSLQLAKTASDPALCHPALDRIAGRTVQRLAERVDGPTCHIRTRVELSRLGAVTLAPVETRCETALRLAMWTRHVLQPAALAHLGSPIVEVLHLSSYACRRIRTTAGIGASMSAHATARAIDISGVRLANGRVVPLLGRWSGAGADQAFWRAARDGACPYFRTVLSPDYNVLHADHFHLEQGRWRACR